MARGTTPPNNIGARSTPSYRGLVSKSIVSFDGGASKRSPVRDDPFFGDIGAIFDLVAIRKGTGNMGGGKDFFAGYGVHVRRAGTDRRARGEERGDRRVGVRRPAEGHDPRFLHARQRGVGPGQPAREPARQRGDHPDRPQGPLERPAAVERVGVPQVLHGADPRRGDQQAVLSRRSREGPRRPRGGPAHRRAEAQLHGAEARRRAPAQPHDSGGRGPEPARGARG